MFSPQPAFSRFPALWSSGRLCPGEADGCSSLPCALQTLASATWLGTLGMKSVSGRGGHPNPMRIHLTPDLDVVAIGCQTESAEQLY